MSKRLIALLAISMVFGMVTQAVAWDIEVAVGGWQQDISGTLGFDEIIDSADIIDIDNDFDFDSELRVFGRARLNLPLFLPNIYVLAAPMQFSGPGSKSVQFDFGDLTDIPADASLNNDITLNQYDIALFWGIPALKMATGGTFNIDLGLNVRWAELDAKLQASDGGSFNQRDEASVSAPIPMLFLAAQFMPTDTFAIEAEGRGISIGDNKLYSIIGRVRYNFTGPVFITGGYRFDKLELDTDDVVADIEYKGPFVELGFQF